MQSLKVRLKDRAYPINIQAGLRNRFPALFRSFAGQGRIIVLSDTHLKALYPGLFTALRSESCEVLFIRPGEQSKTLDTVNRVTAFMLKKGFDRSSLLVAMGGGVVGDIGGFTASIYMRGIPYLQAPTTLLAQVDSSVGGKTGVNHKLGKNMMGTFHQPRAVLIDTEFLQTLPQREFSSGFAEVVKHGIIRSPRLFGFLEKNFDGILNREARFLDQMVAENCRIKAEIVALDEKEDGLRAVLNFGHTFGHAVETLTGYKSLTHGEALFLGMRAAIHTALELRMIAPGTAARMLSFLGRLPQSPRVSLRARSVYGKMFSDKKTRKGRLNLILPVRIGLTRKVSGVEKGAVLKGIAMMTGVC